MTPRPGASPPPSAAPAAYVVAFCTRWKEIRRHGPPIRPPRPARPRRPRSGGRQGINGGQVAHDQVTGTAWPPAGRGAGRGGAGASRDRSRRTATAVGLQCRGNPHAALCITARTATLFLNFPPPRPREVNGVQIAPTRGPVWPLHCGAAQCSAAGRPAAPPSELYFGRQAMSRPCVAIRPLAGPRRHMAWQGRVADCCLRRWLAGWLSSISVSTGTSGGPRPRPAPLAPIARRASSSTPGRPSLLLPDSDNDDQSHSGETP